MDTSKAWTEVFRVYTDGDNVWLMQGDQMAGSARILPDIDGPDAALRSAVVSLVQEAAVAVPA